MEQLTISEDDSNYNLALALARADTVGSVESILKEFGYWNDPTAWADYGGMENNYANIGNQQGSPDSALIEKLINAVDAVLMAKCLKNGIDPESEAAPQSIEEALTQYFNFESGNLSDIDNTQRTKLAEQYLGLVATGKRGAPSITVFDKGCGQRPERFKDTFLSLNASNKIKINFVQGKFNMGSTGALAFCGGDNLQLIISRRMPGLDQDSKSSLWGVTVIRREPPTASMRSSKYTYLEPRGEILSFPADCLPIIPSSGSFPNADNASLQYGSFIKLYEYELGNLKTSILLDLYNRLSLLLPSLPLPFRLYERRNYSAHSYETTLAGLSSRVADDRSKNIEPGFPCSISLSIDTQDINVQIIAFKKNKSSSEKSAREKYAGREGVLFTLNGQAHGYLTKDIFGYKNVGMGYLKDSLIVIVDCSGISNSHKEQLFMNSRDRLRNSEFSKQLQTQLFESIGNHAGLKKLREERKRAAIDEVISDDKPLQNLLEEVIKSSPALSRILLKGQRLNNPFSDDVASGTQEYKGERYPSFFEPEKVYTEASPKQCEKGRDFRVKFRTDVENEYLSRADSPGQIIISSPDHGRLDCSVSLYNGIANLKITPPENLQLGRKIAIEVEVQDESAFTPIQNVFYIAIAPFNKSIRGDKSPSKRMPAGKQKGDDSNKPSQLALPPVQAVYKTNWNDYEMDQFTALSVIFGGDEEGYDFFYNADNIHLKTEQKYAKDEDITIIETQYKTALVLLGMGIIEELRETDIDASEHIKQVTRAISPVLLPIIRGLGSLNPEL